MYYLHNLLIGHPSPYFCCAEFLGMAILAAANDTVRLVVYCHIRRIHECKYKCLCCR